MITNTIGAQSPVILGQWGIGHLVPSLAAANSATYSQVGNVVVVTSTAHAVPVNVHNGKNVYLSGVSGNIVDGWFSNLKVIDANTFQCFSDIEQTTSGNLATNTTQTIIPMSVLIPGGAMGDNGQLVINEQYSYISSANNKTRFMRYNGTNFVSNARTTGVQDSVTSRIRNRGSQGNNTFYQQSESLVSSASGISVLALDTSKDGTISYGITVAAASEFMSLDAFQVVLYPG